jgi:8-oxo-dGTP pyrophosphatase MutT (NUDIX family)
VIFKACPVVPHPDGHPARLLSFLHPLTGSQLVKGTVEPGENPLQAMRRELFEETGLRARAIIDLGHSDDVQPSERWHFALVRVRGPVKEQWLHHTHDGGGLDFHCRWTAVDSPHPFEERFARAWDVIQSRLALRTLT